VINKAGDVRGARHVNLGFVQSESASDEQAARGQRQNQDPYWMRAFCVEAKPHKVLPRWQITRIRSTQDQGLALSAMFSLLLS
jgi:hypothetical protein